MLGENGTVTFLVNKIMKNSSISINGEDHELLINFSSLFHFKNLYIYIETV